jgi:dihydroorotate dehydrogenase
MGAYKHSCLKMLMDTASFVCGFKNSSLKVACAPYNCHMLNLATTLSRKALFSLEPEDAHALTLATLNTMAITGASRLLFPAPAVEPVQVMGLTFPNRVGLAAGADKNGECIDGFGALGFGFLELGGVTPRAQPGNDKPRVFRLPEAQAVINRLGFNNHGLDTLVSSLQTHRHIGRYGRKTPGIIGVNLGKNKDTPNDKALDDYAACYTQLYPLIDFATINVSSPNTKDLRALQETDELRTILQGMKTLQATLADQHGKYVPLSVKIAPDLDDAQIQAIAKLVLDCKMDAITATNTTVARDGVAHLPHAEETGGLSGAPVFARSNEVIRKLAKHLDGALAIIGVGGIMRGADAKTKLEAGATLVQFYTGLIYQGPQLVSEAIRATSEG